jgi:hypothetical protein
LNLRANCSAGYLGAMSTRHPCVVLVPAGRPVEPKCEAGLRELERRGYPVRRVYGASGIDVTRSQMATDALRDGFEELFWIDSDIVFRPDDVEKLRAHNLPFTCGLYAKKGVRQLAATFLRTETIVLGDKGGLVEIQFAGFGFTHTRRFVYERMPGTFHMPPCNERFGNPFVPYFAPGPVQDGAGHWYLPEDYAFCDRARRCGFPLMADTSVRLWHVGNYAYGWEDAGEDRRRLPNYAYRVLA